MEWEICLYLVCAVCTKFVLEYIKYKKKKLICRHNLLPINHAVRKKDIFCYYLKKKKYTQAEDKVNIHIPNLYYIIMYIVHIEIYN